MTIFPYASTEIFYPDEDGLPVAESDFQREYLLDSVKILEIYFQEQADIYVSGNLFIYYEQGNPASVVAPDVFVIKGVEKRQRRSYKMWEEGGKAPNFVMEVTSMSTRTQDQGSKKGIYAFLGVQEYFQYDPTGDYLDPQIRGSSLENGNYFTLPQTVLPDGTISMMSVVLGLELRVLPDGKLRFYNTQTEEYLLTHQETEQARLSAEQARLSAEQKAQRLAEKLRELGIDPESL
jgi:Uma2 family endonuclease